MEDDIQWKTTYNGRQPQNSQSGISQQPFIGSYSNLNLSLYDVTIFYESFKLRPTPMEDNLKILKVEYLRTCLMDHTQF